MTPEEIQLIAIDCSKIAAIFGALGAVAVLAVLSVLRGFSDWMLEREERSQRIAAARKRVRVQREAKAVA